MLYMYRMTQNGNQDKREKKREKEKKDNCEKKTSIPRENCKRYRVLILYKAK